MTVREKNKKQNNRIFLWLFAAVIFATTLSIQIWNNLQETAHLNEKMKLVEVENVHVKMKKIELQTQVDLLMDDEYVLKLARARGFYSLPNELIFNIPEQNGLLKNEKVRQEALKQEGLNKNE